MFIDFVDNHLDHIRWANEEEQKEFWQVEGIIKKYSNQLLKFDVSFLKEYPDDKVIDYVINLQLKEVRLEELIDKLKCNTLIKMKD